MSVSSRSIMEGLQIGQALGKPFNDYFMQKNQIDADKAAQELRLNQAIQEMALKDPDLAKSLTQIQQGQTVDGQQSVKPLPLTDDQAMALSKAKFSYSPEGATQVSGESVPVVPTTEVGSVGGQKGYAYDPATYKKARLQDEVDAAQRHFDLQCKLANLNANLDVDTAGKKATLLEPFEMRKEQRQADERRGLMDIETTNKLKELETQYALAGKNQDNASQASLANEIATLREKARLEMVNPKQKTPSESQANAGLFGARAQQAENDLNAIKGFDPTTVNPLKHPVDATGNLLATAGIPFTDISMLPNSFRSPERQKFAQAKENFISAVLRKESGASISKPEMEKADKQYFPQVGDSSEVVDQKAANRALAIQGLNAIAKGEVFSGENVPEKSSSPIQIKSITKVK